MALIELQEVRRLFQVLVELLAERDPGRLQAPFQVAELYQQIIPYRAYRARLRFDTNQDYEAAVLGLLAGTGGFATVEPAEAQEALAAEAASANPDLGLFREFAGARVRLQTARVRELLDRPASYAPPQAEPAPRPPADPLPSPAFVLEREPPATTADLSCQSCGRPLPGHRPVVFCPWCGRPVGSTTCGRCGDELEEGWRFCPRCGLERRS